MPLTASRSALTSASLRLPDSSTKIMMSMLLSIVGDTSSALLTDPGITDKPAMIKIEASFSIFKMTTP